MVESGGVRVVVLTGDGKGKSSSALGMVLRAVGHGMRVGVVQFLKQRQDTGELKGLALLPGVEVFVSGAGFVVPVDGEVEDCHRVAAGKGVERAVELLGDAAVDMVVLDELCGAIALGLVSLERVLGLVRGASAGKVVVITGRGAPAELVELADTVSEVVEVKHGMAVGWPAQRGVEW